MKMMMNGAITLGTLDGANVEIADAVGKDNIYLFGLESSEVDDLWRKGYDSYSFYASSEKITKVIVATPIGRFVRKIITIIHRVDAIEE